MRKKANVKYVFLDVVRFTVERTAEAQSDIIDVINEITHAALTAVDVSKKRRYLLPTGDGLCIALVDIKDFDVHLRLACEILSRLQDHNDHTADKRRQFLIRVGINEHTDNIIRDINGHPNVAGAGINLAQRIMSVADGGQILVGPRVHSELSDLDMYSEKFREFKVLGKHGMPLNVFQYIGPTSGMNSNIPSAFRNAVIPNGTVGFLGHVLSPFSDGDCLTILDTFLDQVTLQEQGGNKLYEVLKRLMRDKDACLYFIGLSYTQRTRAQIIARAILSGEGRAFVGNLEHFWDFVALMIEQFPGRIRAREIEFLPSAAVFAVARCVAAEHRRMPEISLIDCLRNNDTTQPVGNDTAELLVNTEDLYYAPMVSTSSHRGPYQRVSPASGTDDWRIDYIDVCWKLGEEFDAERWHSAAAERKEIFSEPFLAQLDRVAQRRMPEGTSLLT